MPSDPSHPLTLKQRRFVEALPTAKSFKDAAIQAGYSISSPHMPEVIGSENMRKPEIKAALVELGMDASKFAAVLSIAKRKERLSRLAEPDPEHPDPMRAIDLLNRMESLYVDRTQGEVTHRLELVVKLRPTVISAIDAKVLPDATK